MYNLIEREINMNKTYIINDSIYHFDYETFKDLFRNKKRNENITFEKIELELSKELNISKEAIHNWRFKKHSPENKETIMKIAKYFNIKDYKLLLIGKEGKNMHNLNNYQINSLKIINDSIIEYLNYFYKTDGYNNLWLNFADKGIKPQYIEDKLWEVAEEKIDKLILYYDMQRIFLKNTNIYEELGEYIYNDLYDIFNGKLSYAYRFEAILMGNPTTQEDYENALKKYNSIIDKYIN